MRESDNNPKIIVKRIAFTRIIIMRMFICVCGYALNLMDID